MAKDIGGDLPEVDINVGFDELAWFDDSPDAGDPDCICSYCGRFIDEDQVPVRLTNEETNKEARFCEDCTPIVFGCGYTTL